MFNKKSDILSLCTLFLPWLSAPFLGKQVFKRFTSVAIFTNILWSIISVVANKKKWWKANPFILKNVPIDIPFVAGIYFVTTLWVFKLTYGNFKKYFTLNAIIDLILAFPIVKFYEKMGAYKLRKMPPIIFYLLVVSLAVIIYGYQYSLEKLIKKFSTKGCFNDQKATN
ncbi:hypothetical protein [Bacillus sp. ISL-39]|uniref:hypothetical protein n=1 Tax=Bacillus sp. ISL-39 TaxID=2819124 RepID=UPI001BE89B54|nr:hypothetical protein [Bacillus sp. ISL-39]MBT2636449.1 hypothetical protein [Bacillus sp. ISL-39]